MPTPYTGSSTSSVPNSTDSQINGLLWGTKWGGPAGTGATVSYSFPGAGATWSTNPYTGYGSPSGGGEPWDSHYAGLNASQKAGVQAALQAWANVANITLAPSADTASVVGDIRVAMTGIPDIQDSYAWSYLPSATAAGGDVWLNVFEPSNYGLSLGSNGAETVIHELGHALGLKHPFSSSGSGVTLPVSLDSYKYTVMSYSDYAGYPDYGTCSFYPTTPMLLDILAIQYLYGANMSYHAGDDTYTFTQNQDVYETIWDAGGNDTIQYVSLTGGLIDLRAGNFSQLGKPIVLSDGAMQKDTVAIAYNVTIENATGGDGDDTIVGNNVGNRLEGGGGNDSIAGGDADDSLAGGAGNDTLEGGAGNDIADYSAASAAIAASLATGSASGNDIGQDTLSGIEGVLGGAGDDTLEGGSGNDSLKGGAGNDSLYGGLGNDSLDAGTGTDTLTGGEGNDRLGGSGDHSLLLGGLGDDSIEFSGGNSSLRGGGGNDWVDGSDGADDELRGGLGSDTVLGGAGDDTLYGGLGNDIVDGAAGADFLTGGEGNDTLTGSGAHSLLLGGLGDDSIEFSGGSSSLRGGAGNDWLDGSGGTDDELRGGMGSDTLLGGAGEDTIYGGQGNDSVLGADGADSLFGGAGNDAISGGGGNDRFFYTSTALSNGDLVAGTDTTDIAAGDLLDFSAAVEAVLRGGGQTLSEGVLADIVLDDSLEASPAGDNIAFIGGQIVVDLDGDGTYSAATDLAINVDASVTTVTYDTANDYFTFT